VTKIIRAAGGVVIDPNRRGRYLVVHRPKYDDWSFPKGKVARGESFRECAIREVGEETGLVCEPIEELKPVEYVTRHGNLKTVRFWIMEPLSGTFAVNDEVDAVTWIKRSQALSLLTHDYDHSVLVEAHRRVKEVRQATKKAARQALRAAH
jgi:8-oxo-dGTP diphosphatase